MSLQVKQCIIHPKLARVNKYQIQEHFSDSIRKKWCKFSNARHVSIIIQLVLLRLKINQ